MKVLVPLLERIVFIFNEICSGGRVTFASDEFAPF